MTDLEKAVDSLMTLAIQAGADDAVASAGMSIGLDASMREGVLEEMTRSESKEIGLRVITDGRQACVSSSIMSDDALREMSERAVAMAREAPQDPYCGLADPAQLASDSVDLDLFDPGEAKPDELAAMAAQIDAAARNVEGVSKTESSGASWHKTDIAVAMSNGFATTKRGTAWSAVGVAIAGEGLGMERDYDYDSTRWLSDLPDLADIGKRAGERTVRRINPRKIAEQKRVPIIYEQRAASSLLSHFAGAINGAGVARGSTFLKDRMGEQIFAKGIRISDDPRVIRGMASRAIDSEGLPTAARDLVSEGVVQSWLLDLSNARQLGLESTASASAGIGSVPRPSSSNLMLHPGKRSLEEMIGDLKEGFLVTELIGSSINANTGDYSRGAVGHWIENGEIAYPVTEATIAGNLLEMFAAMEPATDMPKHRSIIAPSILIEGCTLAGS